MHSSKSKRPDNSHCFNPFSEHYTPSKFHHMKLKNKDQSMSSKPRTGRCFQLVMICQKLLKPFSHSSNKTKSLKQVKKYQSAYQIHCEETPKPIKTKVDACCQTYFQDEDYDDNDDVQEISELPHQLKTPAITSKSNHLMTQSFIEPQSPGFWDLDIDSAIVGDFNSLSELSLDERVDPLYSTIKFNEFGEPIKPSPNHNYQQLFELDFSSPPSNISTPKSGIYSKIVKPSRPAYPVDFNSSQPSMLASSPPMKFQQIMHIKSQLGLKRSCSSHLEVEGPALSTDSLRNVNNSPKLPKRNYGNSVINLIAKCRQKLIPAKHTASVASSQSSDLNQGLYSKIWQSPLHHTDSFTHPSTVTIPIKYWNYTGNNNISSNQSSFNYIYPEYDSIYPTPSQSTGISNKLRHIDSELDIHNTTNIKSSNHIQHPIESSENIKCSTSSMQKPIEYESHINPPSNNNKQLSNHNCYGDKNANALCPLLPGDICCRCHNDSGSSSNHDSVLDDYNNNGSYSDEWDTDTDMSTIPRSNWSMLAQSYASSCMLQPLLLQPLMERSCEDDFFIARKSSNISSSSAVLNSSSNYNRLVQ